ncbi:MAG TPA: BatD family protein [Bacteroidales bacterium]|nr:BatD family protein [Bacteroidales bacterium]
MKSRYIGIAFTTILMIFGMELAAADEVVFTATAPSKVILGQQFRLTYTLNAETKDLRIPEITDFEVLMGPSTAKSTQISIVNGQRTSLVEHSYTYVLMPVKVGSFTIPAATATIKKEKRSSNPLTITVLPQDKSTGGASDQGTSSQQTVGFNGEQAFIRAIPSKTKVFEQEGLLLTYKLYTRVDISGVNNIKFPEFKGFLAQEIEIDPNTQWDMENYEGLNYRTAVLKQTILYPQQSGEIEIESGSFDLIFRIRNTNQRMRSLFDDFFDSYQEVRKTILSPKLRIQVEPFPFGKPANFNPFSGNLRLSSSINTTQVKADEAVTIKLELSGEGNMKMLRIPELKFPADFDVYDPKVTNNFKTTTRGVSGTKTIEYLVIPRYSGSFTIPSVNISYFDLTDKSYKILSTDEFQLEVGRSEQNKEGVVAGTVVSREQLRLLGQDIRYIKVDNIRLRPRTNLIYGKTAFWLAYILPFLFFLLMLYIYRKQAKANADLAAVRTRKANKVAVKRLKKASFYLKNQDKEQFLDEVLRALWGYTSDKLNIPVSQLNKDNIEAQLNRRKVDTEVCAEFLQILQACEFERYAPVTEPQHMGDLYTRTLEIINQMENTINNVHVKK